MLTLNLQPDQTGYRITKANNIASTDLPGGFARQRLDFIGGVDTCDVQFTLDYDGFNYLEAFYRTAISYGASPFTLSLINGTSDVQPYAVQIIPGTYGLITQQGLTYVVGMSLQVQPLAVDSDSDNDIIALYGQFGDDTVQAVMNLAILVNVQCAAV